MKYRRTYLLGSFPRSILLVCLSCVGVLVQHYFKHLLQFKHFRSSHNYLNYLIAYNILFKLHFFPIAFLSAQGFLFVTSKCT